MAFRLHTALPAPMRPPVEEAGGGGSGLVGAAVVTQPVAPAGVLRQGHRLTGAVSTTAPAAPAGRLRQGHRLVGVAAVTQPLAYPGVLTRSTPVSSDSTIAALYASGAACSRLYDSVSTVTPVIY